MKIDEFAYSKDFYSESSSIKVPLITFKLWDILEPIEAIALFIHEAEVVGL